MNINFSNLEYAMDRFDRCRGDKFSFEEDTLIVTEKGFSISLIRTCDIAECGYDREAVAIYFTSLADKMDAAVQEALKGSSSSVKECKVLRNRVLNFCWIMHDFITTCKEMEDGKPFKELEIRFWKQKMELAFANGPEETCVLHPDIEELLSNPDIRKALYTKKYPFSDDSLNVQALGIGMITGKISNIPVSPQILFMLLEHHSELGDENAQERLYSFLEQPIGKTNLVDLNKASVLLESAFKQEKMWSIKIKIKEMVKNDQDKSFSTIPLYIMAAHKGDLESIKKLMEILGEKVLFTIPDNEKMILKDYSLYKYMKDGFGTTPWLHSEKPWLTYGVPLTSIGFQLQQIGSVSNAMKYYKEAALLGDLNAMVMFGLISLQQGNLCDALYWNSLAAAKGNASAMTSAGALERLSFKGHEPNLQNALKWSTAAANCGNIEGSYCAGECEEKEFEGHVANPERALEFYTYAAEKGHLASMCSCGVLEVKTNPLKAIYWWTRASDLCHIKSMRFLGCLVANGFPGHPSDNPKALYWLTKASDAKDIEAMTVLAMLEAEEFDSHPANPARALKLSKEAAEAGHSGAMNNVGLLEERVFQNHKACPGNALYWFRKSAENGCAIGMRNVVRITTKKNEALKWSSLAGKAGDRDLMRWAGQLEAETFDGHASNLVKSLEWYTKAAELGSDIAMFNAGLLEADTFNGHIPNLAKALEWYEKAAKLGLGEAMFNAGLLEMSDFDGHPSNNRKALEWIVEAAGAGHVDAMGLIAARLLSQKDQIDEKLIGQALFWLRKAYAAGSKFAKSILDTMPEASSKKDEEILAILNHEHTPQSCLISNAQIVVPIQNKLEGTTVSLQTENSFSKESDESDDSANELEAELLSYSDLSQYKPVESDASNVKAQFAKMDEINNKLEKTQVALKDLSPKNQLIWESLKDENSPCITIAELIHFAEDEAFIGKFAYGPTASGIMFCLANKSNGVEKYGTVSTHRKHNKSYKGANKKFLGNFRQMVSTVLGFE